MIRPIATEEERIRLIRECQQSGLTANKWCRQNASFLAPARSSCFFGGAAKTLSESPPEALIAESEILAGLFAEKIPGRLSGEAEKGG